MKKIFFAIAFFGAAVLLAQEVPQLETYKLKNGLKVYLMQYGKLPAVHVRLMVNSGKKNEAPGQQGYSYLCSFMLLGGNKKYSEEQQTDLAFKLGADMSASSDYDHTTVRANFLSKDLDAGMDLFSAAVISPVFDKEKVDREISYRIDYNNVNKMDIANLTDVFSEYVLYGSANPLGRQWYKKQLEAVTPEKMKEYHAFNFTPGNASIIVCGNFDHTKAKAVIEKYFGSWQSAYGEVNGVALDKPAIKKKETCFVNRANATQCNLRWSKIAPSVKDKDYMAFRVANQIFNRYIFVEVREKGGKTYSIGSTHEASQFSNLFVTSCSVRNSEMLSTMELFDKSLQAFGAGNITQEDFDMAVTAIKINMASSEMPEAVASFYNPVVYDFNKRKNFLTDLATVKLEDVQKAIRKYYTADSYKLVVAGDESKVSDQLTRMPGLKKLTATDIEKDN
jgi:predicted Zn-dependent peptidase